ncbi:MULTISPECIES: transposase [Oscillatoriales]
MTNAIPPYSPDLNKIEKCWSWLKARIRHCT